jgi:hypothetical protein
MGKRMSCEEKIDFIKGWKEANEKMLAQMGLGPLSFGEEEQKFVTGIFFLTMPARSVVPFCQTAYKEMSLTYQICCSYLPSLVTGPEECILVLFLLLFFSW